MVKPKQRYGKWRLYRLWKDLFRFFYVRYEKIYAIEEEDVSMTDDDGIARKWMPRQN